MTDEARAEDASDPEEPDASASGDPADDRNVVDDYRERAIDRFARGAVGSAAGAAMIGMEKGMGFHKPVEEAAVIRESGDPDRDPDDPIEIAIDPDHPENTRIVFHVRAPDDPAPTS